MKKIFVVIMIICCSIFAIGCNQYKQSTQQNNPESSSTATESNPKTNPSTVQNNSSNQTISTEAENSQNNNSNTKINNSSTDKKNNKANSRKSNYIKMLNDIQIKIDNEIDEDKLSTTLDMIQANDKRYKLWDDALNKIYSDLKTSLSPADMEKLKQEELTWISKKEIDAKNAAKEVEGGTLYPVLYSGSLVNSTKQRCYELVDKYVQ